MTSADETRGGRTVRRSRRVDPSDGAVARRRCDQQQQPQHDHPAKPLPLLIPASDGRIDCPNIAGAPEQLL